MNTRFQRVTLVLLAAVLLAGASGVQQSLNRDRELLGLTRVQPLENAPPLLAFTTVAMGGFRGLISNLLWSRANELQEDGKYFELAQLADWITTLEPHYTQVWIFQAWNLGWNISVKFKDFPDRWRWVRRGMELLRDDALKYNPDELLLYRELAWFFQDKMGKNTDDASFFYKKEWANEMMRLFGDKNVNFEEMIHPQTPDQQARATLLREKYKLDPRLMEEVDRTWGPLDWRVPEAHAIYWAYLAQRIAQYNPTRVNPKDFITLRRVIYQSMLQSFQHGRLEINQFTHVPDFGPNLDIIPKVDEAYRKNLEEHDIYSPDIQRAYWYFLRQAVYFLYVNNRVTDAAKWYAVLGEKFPEKPVLNIVGSLPRNVTLEEFVLASVQEDIDTRTPERVKSAVEGLLSSSYLNLVLDQDDRAAGFKLLARKLYDNYQAHIFASRQEAIGLGDFDEINRHVLERLLDPQRGVRPDVRAALRTKLGLPAETNAPPAKQQAAVPAAEAPKP